MLPILGLFSYIIVSRIWKNTEICTQKPKVEVFALSNTEGGQKRVQTLAVNIV